MSEGEIGDQVRPSNQQDARPTSSERFSAVEVDDSNEMRFGSTAPQLPSQAALAEPQRVVRMIQSSQPKAAQKRSAQQHFSAAAASRKVVLGSRYAEALQKFDQARGHDQLVSYFCTIGMEDADIVHSVMAVKEMIYCDYQLNGQLHDDLVSNDGILTGDRPFFADPQNPKFHVPVFQPKILSRVPSVDRSKLLFPINLADFAFPDGVQVIAATEVLKKKQSHIEKCKRPAPQGAAWLDSLPIPALDPKYERDTGRQDSGIERHLMLTNQEGKVYYATCYDYFVDLGHLAEELEEQGHLDQYRLFPAEQIIEVDQKQQKIDEILKQDIPPARYYLQFTMCIVSQKPYKSQFYKMLDRVYYAYVNGELSQQGQQGGLTLEEVVNRIVFRIPNPPRRLDYLAYSCHAKGKVSYRNQHQLIKVVLSDDAEDAVYFKNESPFDVNYSELGNICVLLCKLPSENVNQLFKRLLFNTCTILQSDDIQTVDKCIQGIMQLFYPLNCSITCVPNLPENTLEYISQCSQSVIGVVRHRTRKTGQAKLRQIQEEDEFGTSLTSSEIQQRVAQELSKNDKAQKGSRSHPTETIRSMEFSTDQNQGRGVESFVDVVVPRESTHEKPKNNFIELFDIMQDNSCLIALQRDHPIQKPKQAVCFNSKGRLSHGQGAANRGQNFRGQTGTGRVAYGGRPGGSAETLNDIELPREPVRVIRQAIQRVQKMSFSSLSAIEKDIANIKMLQEQPDTMETQKAILKYHEKLHNTLWPLLLQAREVKLALFDMVREILQYYIKPLLIKDFKGSKTRSGHMPNYLYWQMSMDIFSLIDREQFKRLREPEGARSTFYVKLVLYPSIQNFLCDKFFPQSEEDNLRQLCALPSAAFKPYIPQSHRHRDEEDERNREKMMYEQDRGVLEVVHLLDGKQKSNYSDGNSVARKQSFLEKQRIEQDAAAQNMAQSVYKRQKPPQQRKFYEERSFFPRHLDEQALRRDFQDSHFRVAPRAASKPEEILKKTFEELGVAHHLAPVYELNYRLANHFERRNPRVDIIVAWLLLFVASLDYQLDPFTIAELSDPNGSFHANQQHYRPPAYFACQTKLEQLLAKYFEKAITTLIHKGDYDFNPKCPVLSLLFQHTHSHHYLHQKLLQVVHQDIDQLQSGGSASTGMTVSSSFVIYQLHWNSKQIRRSRRNHNRLKEQTRIDALSAKLDEFTNGKTSNQKYSKLKQLLKDAKRMNLGFDIKTHDPYVLNDKLEEEWQFNESRLALLEMLSQEDHKLDHLNKNNRAIINIQIEKIEAQNNNQGQGQGAKPVQKSGFKSKFFKFIPGKQNANHKAMHAEQVRQDKLAQALKKVKTRLENLEELHKSMFDQRTHQQQLLPRERLGSSLVNDLPSGLRQSMDSNAVSHQQIRESQMSFERTQSQVERAQKERKEKKDQLFEDLLQRPRSFFSLNQLRNAKKMKEGKHEQKQVLTEEDLANARFKMKLNLVNVRCTNCETAGQTPTFTMDGIIHKLKCKTCEKDDVVRGQIQVLLHGDLGTYEITRVRLQGPKKMRSEVESLLKVDRFYKTLQKIDLSAFSQARREIELYWNAVFWFNQQDLDYLWLCPYTSHLGDFVSDAPADRSKSRQPQSSSRPETETHRPFDVDSSNPKGSMLLKLFELQRLKVQDHDDESIQITTSEVVKPESNESEMQGARSTMAESEAQPQSQMKKKVSDMTKDEKMRAAEALYLKRQRQRWAMKAKQDNQDA